MAIHPTIDSDVGADAEGRNGSNDIEGSAVDDTNVLKMRTGCAHVLNVSTGPKRANASQQDAKNEQN